MIRFVRSLMLLIAALPALPAAAQTRAASPDYPMRPVRVLVPYTPGGITDLVTRIVALELGRNFGQTFVVDNRPGANSILAVDMLSK